MRKFEREMARRLKRFGFKATGVTGGDHIAYTHQDPTVGSLVVSSTPRDADAQLVQAEQDARRRLRQGGVMSMVAEKRTATKNGRPRIPKGEVHRRILETLAKSGKPLTAAGIFEQCNSDDWDWGSTPSPHQKVPNAVYQALAALQNAKAVRLLDTDKPRDRRYELLTEAKKAAPVATTSTVDVPVKRTVASDVGDALDLLRETMRAEIEDSLYANTVPKADYEKIVSERDDFKKRLEDVRRAMGVE